MSICALVCAAGVNRGLLRSMWLAGQFDMVVAVDGGYEHALAAGVDIDHVLGDFDSLGYCPNVPGVEVHPSRKDESDLELALRFAQQHGSSEVVVFGCLGARIDHTIAALQILAAAAEQGMGVSAHYPMGDSDQVVRLLCGPAEMRLEVAPGAQPDAEGSYGVVSVFAATETTQGVTVEGMRYPLRDAVLRNRTTLGLSNELEEKTGRIAVGGGTLYIVHPVSFSAVIL